MTAAVDAAYQAALADVARLWATPGAADVESVTQAAVAATVHSLASAGVLAEPRPAPIAMTLDDAARLLCRLSRTRRLDDPDVDYAQLLEHLAMVDYAWEAASVAGIGPADQSGAHEARRMLLAHHRGI